MSTNEDMTPFEESILFYYEIGVAITQWAHVEMALQWLMQSCFHDDDRKMTGLTYFSIENFRSKVQVVDVVMRNKYEGTDYLTEWATVLERIPAIAKGRNKLAHRLVIIFHENQPGKRYALVPWIYKPNKKKSSPSRPTPPPPGSLFIQDVVELRQQFSAVRAGLENLFFRILGRPELILKSHEQPAGRPTTRQLARLLRATNAPHDKS